MASGWGWGGRFRARLARIGTPANDGVRITGAFSATGRGTSFEVQPIVDVQALAPAKRKCPKCTADRTVVMGRSASPPASYIRCVDCGHVFVIATVERRN
jgi:transposase-like protein